MYDSHVAKSPGLLWDDVGPERASDQPQRKTHSGAFNPFLPSGTVPGRRVRQLMNEALRQQLVAVPCQ